MYCLLDELISILEDECTITACSVGKKTLKSDEKAHKNNTTSTSIAAAGVKQNRMKENRNDTHTHKLKMSTESNPHKKCSIQA